MHQIRVATSIALAVCLAVAGCVSQGSYDKLAAEKGESQVFYTMAPPKPESNQ